MDEARSAAFFADLPVPLAIRRDRLRRATRMIEENADALCTALAADQPNQDVDSARNTEVTPALAVLRAAVDGVGGWMRPKSGSGGHVEYRPIGVVGISAPRLLPLLQTAGILANVLAAGNRAVLIFDAASPRLGRLIGELAPRYFDRLELAVAADAAFTELSFDLLVAS